jgi:UTP--glucose-1-phosphate uridylyltransferase
LKGIIIAAGYGTRFFPVTKTIPKEMLPLINKPSIDFIIEEFVSSGIKDILIVTSRRKKALEDYLDREVELESVLKAEGALKKYSKIIPPNANIFFTRQREMKGTGHAMLLARSFIGNDPFILAYPDDIIFSKKPLAKQLIEKYEETGCCVLSTIHNPPEINRYGVITIDKDGQHVTDIVEKPPVGKEPSKEASIGRFLFIPEIFKYLEEGWKKHKQGEYYHIHALRALASKNKVVYKQLEGERLDTGEPGGYLEAILKYAATVPEYRTILKQFLSKL